MADHAAKAVVVAFQDMRDRCEHYGGIKDHPDDVQCTHPENQRCDGNWCAMDVCPLLKERARAESVGWD